MLDYSFIEVQDPDGGLSAIRVSALEVRDMSQEIVERYFRGHPMVERLVSHFDLERLLLYLGKGISDELIPRQMQVKVVSWFRRRTSAKPFPLYTVRCPWMSEMTEYAEACDVGLVWYRRCPSIHWNLTRIPSVCCRAWKALCRRLRRPEKMAVGESFVSRPTGKTIAVHYSGAGLTQDLSHNSDLFWLPSSGIDSSRVLLYFDRGDDPLDAQRVVDLRSQGLRCVALNRRATGHAEVPAYVSDRSQRRRFKLSVRVIKSVIKSLSEPSAHLGWITLQFLEFARQYAYWYAFFEDQNVGVHVNFNDWYGERVASDQALHDLGGISISYQRSEESLIWLRASAVHVHFGFAPKKALDEARAGSHILQFVSAGYVHDHAFHLVGDRSRRLRKRIVEAGAGFVVTYFDENSSGDKRVNVSNQFAEVNYRFLLKRMLEDSTLGVILKPKKPSTLRARLSEDVQDLLDRAIATGRCVLMDEGVVTTPQLPCEPALASDLCIGLLFGATATLEGQLAGTPGILVDRERVTYHPLREQGLGRFVFDDWPSLWSALSSYRRDPDSVPGLGDWGTVLDELD
ncbi:hypothetical protein MK139_18235, partial [bacterium]|nr:hypothetical protein [bacterium]